MSMYVQNSWYENATALFVVLYKRLWLTRFVEKVTTKKCEITFFPQDVEKCKEDKSFVLAVREKLSSMRSELGYYDEDADIYDWAEELKRTKHTIPDRLIASVDGKGKTLNPAFSAPLISFEAEYWTKHEYDDGHSKSGHRFMSETGMGRLGYKVPKDLRVSDSNKEYVFRHADPWSGMDDKAIESFKDVKYHLNCDGLSARDMSLLSEILTSPDRMTPFLVDQRFDLGIREAEIAAYNVQRGRFLGPQPYGSRDIERIMKRLINNHRFYEEARSAYLLFNNWLAQPSTETVESHWWVMLDRHMNVPRLGLMRAAFPVLMSSVGVKITHQAMELASALTEATDAHIFESGACNALWFWGEYLAIHNSKNVASAVRRLESSADVNVDSCMRASAMMSAVLGKVVPTPVFSSAYTTLRGSLIDQGTRSVRFGTIDKTQMAKYGFTSNDQDDVVANTVVAPGALATVLGLNGTLIRGTPISASFVVRAAQYQTDMRGRRTRFLSYFDLWCSGVVARWQGYDLEYKKASSKSSMVMYAPNNTGIAPPPVLNHQEEDVGLYKVGHVEERDHVYGTDFISYWDLDKYFYWSVTKHEALEKCSMRAPIIEGGQPPATLCSHALVQVEPRLDYLTALVAEYSNVDSGFQVERLKTAIPLLGAADPSAFVEEEEPMVLDQVPAVALTDQGE
uniref:Coat protein n=1 Tax=Erysiphales associated totivirus 5 TaxID=2719857 RepID=A0A6G9EN01_9VIRU|nr:coat protein [Erysiphales associated totivirus 5]